MSRATGDSASSWSTVNSAICTTMWKRSSPQGTRRSVDTILTFSNAEIILRTVVQGNGCWVEIIFRRAPIQRRGGWVAPRVSLDDVTEQALVFNENRSQPVQPISLRYTD
jgi:hypothetical protein